MRTRKEILSKILDLTEIDASTIFRRNKHAGEIAILFWVLDKPQSSTKVRK